MPLSGRTCGPPLERGLVRFCAQLGDLRAEGVERERAGERRVAGLALGGGREVVPDAPVLVVALERLAEGRTRRARPTSDEVRLAEALPGLVGPRHPRLRPARLRDPAGGVGTRDRVAGTRERAV